MKKYKAPKERLSARQRTLRIVYYVTMIIFALLFLLPFWGTITTSLKDSTEALSTSPLLLPSTISFKAYGESWELLKEGILNSLIVTVGGSIGSCFLGSICAYALSKFRFKFDGLFFMALSAAIYLPYQAILIPLMQTVTSLNLYDNLFGLILIHTIYGMPMTMSMFRGFYSEVPNALVNQAMIDGNGPWQVYGKIILPNTKIATITVLVFQCTSIWNEMLFALTMTSYWAKPATISLNEMVSSLSADFSIQMAGSIWLTLPILIMYLFMGKYLIRGYMAGAVTAS